MKTVISTDQAPRAIGPYSQAIKAGGFLFVSGQIPLVPATGEMVAGGIEAQTSQVLLNLQNILKAKNLNFADVVKTTVYLTDLQDFAIVNAIYAGSFLEKPPARCCVQVAALPKGAKIEIEAIVECK